MTDPRVRRIFIPPQSLTLADLLGRDAVARRFTDAGMASSPAGAKADMIVRAAGTLLEAGHPRGARAFAVHAPGRIEVLGKHTDYCGGRSLLCAVDHGICMVAVAKTDATIRIHGSDNQTASFALSREIQPVMGHWSNYAMTAARRVAMNFPTAKIGLDVAIESDLPMAAGLSSSSALVTGLFVLLAQSNALAETPSFDTAFRTLEDVAAYCGCIENGSSFGKLIGDRGVGTFGGSQDHTAILCCKPGVISRYRFGPIAHEGDIPLPDDLRFAIINSGVIAQKTGNALALYNEVAARARRVVRLWNESTGQSCPDLNGVFTANADAPQRLDQLLKTLDAAEEQSLRLRIEQFRAEAGNLIPAAAEALHLGQWDRLGELVDASQYLAETHLRNQIPETIALQRDARGAGALAASAFGAGFGGSVWALIRQDDPVPPHACLTRPSIPLTTLD